MELLLILGALFVYQHDSATPHGVPANDARTYGSGPFPSDYDPDWSTLETSEDSLRSVLAWTRGHPDRGADRVRALALIGDLELLANHDGLAHARYRQALSAIESGVAVRDSIQGEICYGLAITSLNTGLDRSASGYARRAREILRGLRWKDPEWYFDLLSLESIAYYFLEEYDSAEALLIRAMREYPVPITSSDSSYFGIVAQLGKVHTAQEEWAEAEAIQSFALSFADSSRPSHARHVADLFDDLSIARYEQGDLEGSLDYLERAIAVAERAAGAASDLTYYRSALADLLWESSDWGGAEIAYRRAVESADWSSPYDLQTMSWSWERLGDLALRREQWERAAACYARSAKLYLRVYGPWSISHDRTLSKYSDLEERIRKNR